jgi:hypothetical protein
MATMSAIMGNLPPLYKNPVPLTNEQHDKLRLDTSSGYDFASQASSVPLVVDEFAVAQRHYPILFTNSRLPMPAALLSIQSGQNPYVSAQGEWKPSAYVPAYVRRYPFLLIRAKANKDNFSLCFDAEAQQISTQGGKTFFAGGRPTDMTKSVMEFCMSYEKNLEATRNACEQIVAHDLFASPSIKLSSGRKRVQLKGFKIVDETKLRKLSAVKLGKLAKSGVLAAIYAHLFSLGLLGQSENIGSGFSTADPKNAN